MDVRLKKAKADIRRFIRAHYTDALLAGLLSHARSGRLCYHTCCCVVGLVNADHEYRGGLSDDEEFGNHFFVAEQLEGGQEAHDAFGILGAPRDRFWRIFIDVNDDMRRRRIISIIRAEMKRRRKAVIAENTMCWGSDGQMRGVV